MTRQLVLVILLLTFGPSVQSSADPGAIILTWGGAKLEEATGLSIDRDGNIYVMGFFRGGGNVDFNPGAGSDMHVPNGVTSFFVSKFGSDGRYIWCRTWDSPTDSAWGDVACDSLGNIYIAANFKKQIDLDPGPTANVVSAADDETKGFLVKLAPDGSYMWGESFDAAIRAIASDGSDNILLTGTTELHDSGSASIFLSKVNSDGIVVWSYTFGGLENKFLLPVDCGVSIAASNNDEIYLAGFFDGTEDLDPGEGIEMRTGQNTNNMFLNKFGADGNLDWVLNWHGDYSWLTPMDLAIDSSRSMFLTGFFEGTIDFDPGEGVEIRSSGETGNAIFLLRLDCMGNYEFVQTFHSTACTKDGYNLVFPNALSLDGEDIIYIAGFWSGSLDFDPGEGEKIHEALPWWDGFVVGLGGDDGSFQSLYIADGSQAYAEDVAISPNGNLCIVGHFEGDMIFEFGEEVSSVYSSAGYEDCFLIILPG